MGDPSGSVRNKCQLHATYSSDCNMSFQLTTSTLPLPLSLMLNGNDSSSPVAGSWSVRKAWCGFLPVLPSVAVRTILRVLVDDRLTAGERAEVRDSLWNVLMLISNHCRV
jgi:hypothetical protein